MEDNLLQAFVKALKDHSQISQIGFMLYELLTDTGFDDEEIQLIIAETHALAVESGSIH